MALPFLAPLLELGTKLLERVLPDPQARAQAQLELLRLHQSGQLAQLAAETDLAKGQQAINLEEAKSDNLFVSGWRPGMGWVCVAIFAANYIAVPLLAWASGIWGWPAPPRLDIGEVLPVLLGMLGLSAYRTVEKIKGA
jgi:hypothetical protein